MDASYAKVSRVLRGIVFRELFDLSSSLQAPPSSFHRKLLYLWLANLTAGGLVDSAKARSRLTDAFQLWRPSVPVRGLNIKRRCPRGTIRGSLKSVCMTKGEKYVHLFDLRTPFGGRQRYYSNLSKSVLFRFVSILKYPASYYDIYIWPLNQWITSPKSNCENTIKLCPGKE